MFRIARSRNTRGFTLIEMILSVVILAVGILSVQRVLISSLGALNTIENWTQAERLLEGKIWELQREVREKKGKFVKRNEQTTLLGVDRVFQYELRLREVDPEGYLWEAQASVFWKHLDAGRSVKRVFYLMVPYEKWKG